MSLRLRLTLILGSAFILLWSLAAAWMLCDLRGQMMRSFDQRLAASARMVAGLLQQLPQPQPADGQTTRLSAEQLGIPNGMACQVSSLRGEVLAQSHATPERALDSTASGFRDQEINGVLWRSFTVQAGDLRVSTADRLEERDVLQRSVVVAAAVPVTVALLGSLALLWLGGGGGGGGPPPPPRAPP
ncbi:sensor histidine kinase N-terminal domain-containing protein, partial [Pseudomonas aeruginosa]|nr:sensor histidine kinase N-terminal domain-containing protein [Pseudomonas aeruginosa]